MLKERITAVLDEAGVRQSEFALATGIQLQRLQNMCAGKIKALRPDEARNIRTAYGYRELWLLEGKGPKRVPPSEANAQPSLDTIAQATSEVVALGLSEAVTPKLQEILFHFRRKDTARLEALLAETEAPTTAGEYVYVPRYDLQASAGDGAVVNDEGIVDHLAFKREWVTQTLGLDAARLALLDVSGDSMSPSIDDGDLILLDTRPHPIRSEGVYVINLKGALLVKRLRIRLSGVIEVVSDNERYGTETISGDDLARLQVVGRVVWQGRRV